MPFESKDVFSDEKAGTTARQFTEDVDDPESAKTVYRGDQGESHMVVFDHNVRVDNS